MDCKGLLLDCYKVSVYSGYSCDSPIVQKFLYYFINKGKEKKYKRYKDIGAEWTLGKVYNGTRGCTYKANKK